MMHTLSDGSRAARDTVGPQPRMRSCFVGLPNDDHRRLTKRSGRKFYDKGSRFPASKTALTSSKFSRFEKVASNQVQESSSTSEEVVTSLRAANKDLEMRLKLEKAKCQRLKATNLEDKGHLAQQDEVIARQQKDLESLCRSKRNWRDMIDMRKKLERLEQENKRLLQLNKGQKEGRQGEERLKKVRQEAAKDLAEAKKDLSLADQLLQDRERSFLKVEGQNAKIKRQLVKAKGQLAKLRTMSEMSQEITKSCKGQLAEALKANEEMRKEREETVQVLKDLKEKYQLQKAINEDLEKQQDRLLAELHVDAKPGQDRVQHCLEEVKALKKSESEHREKASLLKEQLQAIEFSLVNAHLAAVTAQNA